MAPLEVGKFVEITPNAAALKGSFFTAKIIEIIGSRYYCEFADHFDDQGNNLVHMLARSSIRPLPPLVIAPLGIGDVVDVPIIQGWWKSSVVDMNETHVMVKLAFHEAHMVYEIGEVRIHQSWNRKSPSYWRYKKID